MEKSQLFQTSYSALQTFKQCPQKYKFQEIDRIRTPKSREAIFGSIIHETLKFLHSKYPISPTSDEVLNHYKDFWPSLESGPFQNQEEDMIYFSEGIRILKNYYQNFLKNRDKFVVLDTESFFRVMIEKPEKNQKCILTGKIDRIDKLNDGTIEITDYKTAKRLPPQIDADHNSQLSIYCLGFLLRWPHLAKQGPGKIKLTLYYLRHGETLTSKRTKEQLEETKEEIWEAISKIEKANFKPIPSPLCDWCGYKNICPMWKNLYKEQISISDEQIKKLIDEFFELKETNSKNNKRLSELKEIIEKYLNKEKIERVFGKVGYITRLFQTRYKYEMDKIKEILEPLGKWQDVLTIDIEKLKKIIKTLPYSTCKQIEKAKKKDKKYTILKASIGKKNTNNPLQNKK